MDLWKTIRYQLKIGTLIARGLLVPPKTFTIDLGIDDELAGLDATAGDFDMREASKLLNRQILNETVVGHWKERAADRRTIFFCATVEHADAVAAAFRSAGITAETVSGEPHCAGQEPAPEDLNYGPVSPASGKARNASRQ